MRPKNRDMIKSVVVLNGNDNRTQISAERFAAALDAAGVALSKCVIKSYWLDILAEAWHEIEKDTVGSETEVKWHLSTCVRYNT